jgi:hypothetical protein
MVCKDKTKRLPQLNQNLGQAQQDQQFQADQHPLDLQALQANIGHTNALAANANAQNPGMIADSTMKTNAADIDTSTLNDRRSKVHADLAAGLTEAQAKQHQAQAESDLFATLPNGAPDMAKRQAAHLVLDNMPAIMGKIREINAQGGNEIAVANLNNKSREKIDDNDVTHGKYDKYSTISMMNQGFKGNFQQQAGAWGMKAMMDDANGDTAGAEEARRNQQAAIAADYASRTAAGNTANAAKPNIAPLVGVKPVSDPANVPQPPQQPTPLAPVAPSAGGMVQMKDKAGVPHMVPKANVQKALAGGWSQ